MNAPTHASVLVVDDSAFGSKMQYGNSATTRTLNDEDYSASYSSSDDDVVSSQDDHSNEYRNEGATTAGLFIRHPTDRPLPLSAQRTVPLPAISKLWKKHGEVQSKENAPDILRKTGAMTAQYSNDTIPSATTEVQLHSDDYLNGAQICDHSPNGYGELDALSSTSAQADFSNTSSTGKRLFRSKSADYDKRLHREGRVQTRRAVSEVETDDYVNFSSMSVGSSSGSGIFSVLRGRRR